MTILSTLKAGVVALALVGTAVTAMPAQAAPAVGFSLNLGGGGGIVLQFGDDDYDEPLCLTHKQIIKALNNKGYTKVKIVKEYDNSPKVWAVGRKSLKWWQLRVDACTYKVDQVKEIYPLDNNGLTFQLNFVF